MACTRRVLFLLAAGGAARPSLPARGPGAPRLLSLVLLLALCLAPGPASAIEASAGGDGVPVGYEKLGQELARGLLAFKERLDRLPGRAPHPGLRFFAALTEADGLRGQSLLEKGGMESCLVMLDALEHLGVQGVKVAIPYPLLVPGQPLAQDYLDFYARLAQEVRRRGLALYVDMVPALRNRDYVRQRGDARFAALDRLARVARVQAETVLARLAPDILGLVNEPSTAAGKAGLPDLATAEGLPRFLAAVTRDLAGNGTQLAAGLGSWEAPELAAALAVAPGVDILDIHVFPLRSKRTDFLAQADEYAQLARMLGKKAALGEVWLYKASAFQLTPRRPGEPIFGQDILRRDMFGFWSPLDTAFLQLMAGLAQARDLEFVCPARPQYLFSYLEHQFALESHAYNAAMRKAEAAAFLAMRSDHLSLTGEALRKLIRQSAP